MTDPVILWTRQILEQSRAERLDFQRPIAITQQQILDALFKIRKNLAALRAANTEVTSSISGVSTAAEMTGTASTQLMSLSSSLNEQSAQLQREVTEFVAKLRSA